MYIKKRIKNNTGTVKVAAIVIAAAFCMLFTDYTVYANQHSSKVCLSDITSDEARQKNSTDSEMTLKVPTSIAWKEKRIRDTYKDKTIRYVLRNKQVKVYADNELIWSSDDDFFVQDMFVADVDVAEREKHSARVSEKSEKELVLLLWKEGRYGMHRPFWIDEDEKQYSQHIFVYNIENDKVLCKWGSSYMGKEAVSMEFDNGLLFLSHRDENESAWKWYSFGFEKLEPVKFLMAGDNLIHDNVYLDAIKNHDGKFEYLYKKIEPDIKEADFSVINLETPLVDDPKKYSTYPCFGTPIEVAEGIKNSGFDAVTLSTNHRFDKGVYGIETTLDALDKNRLIHVGSMDEKPYVLVRRNEITFALMNYTYGTNGIRPPKGYENGVNYLTDKEKIHEDIEEAKDNSDCIIMFLHWGNEYMKEPVKSQIMWRDFFYEEGVDIIVGTHPHIIEKYEMYRPDDGNREMLVYYSLGNYISGNQRTDHNGGGIGTFEVGISSKGTYILNPNFKEIDTIYKSEKYMN